MKTSLGWLAPEMAPRKPLPLSWTGRRQPFLTQKQNKNENSEVQNKREFFVNCLFSAKCFSGTILKLYQGWMRGHFEFKIDFLFSNMFFQWQAVVSEKTIKGVRYLHTWRKISTCFFTVPLEEYAQWIIYYESSKLIWTCYRWKVVKKNIKSQKSCNGLWNFTND